MKKFYKKLLVVGEDRAFEDNVTTQDKNPLLSEYIPTIENAQNISVVKTLKGEEINLNCDLDKISAREYLNLFNREIVEIHIEISSENEFKTITEALQKTKRNYLYIVK